MDITFVLKRRVLLGVSGTLYLVPKGIEDINKHNFILRMVSLAIYIYIGFIIEFCIFKVFIDRYVIISLKKSYFTWFWLHSFVI